MVCLYFAGAGLCADGESQESSGDSTLHRIKAMRDRIIAERLKIKPYRPKMLMPSEQAMKWQLVRLARMARNRYPDPNNRVEDMLSEINLYPEEAKIRMVSLVMAGGAAQVVLRVSRRLLARRGLGFIVPNLSGLHLSSHLPVLATRMSFHVASFTERRLSAIIKNKLTAFYFENDDQRQRGAYLQIYRGTSLIGILAATRWSDYRSFGLSHYSKWLQFSFIYQKNMTYPDADAAAIYFRLLLF